MFGSFNVGPLCSMNFLHKCSMQIACPFISNKVWECTVPPLEDKAAAVRLEGMWFQSLKARPESVLLSVRNAILAFRLHHLGVAKNRWVGGGICRFLYMIFCRIYVSTKGFSAARQRAHLYPWCLGDGPDLFSKGSDWLKLVIKMFMLIDMLIDILMANSAISQAYIAVTCFS